MTTPVKSLPAPVTRHIHRGGWGLACLVLLLLGSGLAFGDAPKAPPLAPQYRQWLDLVDYIITPEERSIFKKLGNDRDRDGFINVFWNQRDPTRGTPENEFKDEHIKRFKYADRYFGFTSPLPGWKTDRGRIYILLGPPVTRNEVFNSYLYPIEIWEYYGDPAKGLPTMFHVVFYRKGGAGDFKLYIPAVDGPDKLLVTQIGEFNSGLRLHLRETLRDQARGCRNLLDTGPHRKDDQLLALHAGHVPDGQDL